MIMANGDATDYNQEGYVYNISKTFTEPDSKAQPHDLLLDSYGYCLCLIYFISNREFLSI